jgi:hypothetical protein
MNIAKNRLEEVLAGEEANYLLPFIWQRGEDEAVIRTEMARIDAAGIGAVCVEARPHPDFLGPRWWRDSTPSWKKPGRGACGCGCWMTTTS